MITEQIRTLEYIQKFLVYSSSSKTTEIYTHVIDYAQQIFRLGGYLSNINKLHEKEK